MKYILYIIKFYKIYIQIIKASPKKKLKHQYPKKKNKKPIYTNINTKKKKKN